MGDEHPVAELQGDAQRMGGVPGGRGVFPAVETELGGVADVVGHHPSVADPLGD
jgi:hypothetical protein